MEGLNFIELSDSHEAITREDFHNRQDKRRNYVEESVQNISSQNRQEFRDGIQKILTDLKVAINKGNEDDDSAKKKEDEQKRVELKTNESDRVYEDLGFKPNLKYGSKSSLRKECSRFLRCAYLLDFITMDALTTIYLNSVSSLFNKLEYLGKVEIKFEFDTNKSQFGENVKSKKMIYTKPEPMFKLEGKFQDDEIPESEYVEKKIRKYVPPPMGTSVPADFDPIVHLELEDPDLEKEEEEVDILDESDEESKYNVRKVCPTLHKEWIRLEPNKGSFIDLLEESINQGYDSLKNIERWSRHGELVKYVKVLESWDDKVCDSWDPPDDIYLDCDSWLDEDLKTHQYTKIQGFVNDAFRKAERFIENFQPYLHKYHDDKQIDFEVILHRHLKNPQEVLPILLKNITQQMSDFDDHLPENADLGLLKIDFHKVKAKLKPKPKEIFERLKKELPKVVKSRLQEKKQWIIDQTESISSPAIEVDQYVAQVQALEFIDRNIQKVKDEIDMLQSIYNICTSNGIDISKDDHNQVSIIYQLNQKLEQQRMETTESIDNKKKNNIEKVKKQIPVFRKKLGEYRKDLGDEKFLDVKSNLATMQDEMRKMQKK